jgi:hypothetical protein
MGEAMETASDAITIDYDCAPGELREALKVMTRPLEGQPKKSGGVAKFVAILGLQLAIMLGYIYLDAPHQPRFIVPGHTDSTHSQVLLFEWIAAAGLAMFILGFAPGQISKRIPKRRRQRGTQVSFQSDGLIQRRTNRVSKLKWDAFRGVDEGPNVFILRFAATKSLVFPKRLFKSETEVTQLIQLLRGKTTREAIPYSTAFEVVPR